MIKMRLVINHIIHNKFLTFVAIIEIIIATVMLNLILSTAMSIFSYCRFAPGFNDPQLYEATDIIWESFTFDENGNSYIQSMTYEEFYGTSSEAYAHETGMDAQTVLDTAYYDYDIRWLNQHTLNDSGDWVLISYTEADNNINSVYNRVETVMKNNSVMSSISCVSRLRFDTVYTERFTARDLTVFDDNIANRLKMNVTKGKSIAETENNGDNIEALVIAGADTMTNIQLDESFPIRIYNFAAEKYETKNVTIVGFLDSPYYSMVSTSYSYSDADFELDQLIGRYIMGNETNHISLFIKPFEGYDVHAYFPTIIKNFYYSISEDATTDQIQKINDEFIADGFSPRSVKEAYDNTFIAALRVLQRDFFTIIIGFVISLCITVGTILLMLNKDKKKFRVYTLVGASPVSNSYIVILYTSFMFAISGIVSLIYLYYQKEQNVEFSNRLFSLEFGLTNIFVTLIFYVLILCICVLVSAIHFRKRDVS